MSLLCAAYEGSGGGTRRRWCVPQDQTGRMSSTEVLASGSTASNIKCNESYPALVKVIGKQVLLVVANRSRVVVVVGGDLVRVGVHDGTGWSGTRRRRGRGVLFSDAG